MYAVQYEKCFNAQSTKHGLLCITMSECQCIMG